jgi:hypothetical protein
MRNVRIRWWSHADSYSSVAPPVEPEDDGVVPPLVLRATQMGLDV